MTRTSCAITGGTRFITITVCPVELQTKQVTETHGHGQKRRKTIGRVDAACYFQQIGQINSAWSRRQYDCFYVRRAWGCDWLFRAPRGGVSGSVLASPSNVWWNKPQSHRVKGRYIRERWIIRRLLIYINKTWQNIATWHGQRYRLHSCFPQVFASFQTFRLPVRYAAARLLSPEPPGADTTGTVGAIAAGFAYSSVQNQACQVPNEAKPAGSAPLEPLLSPLRPCCTVGLSTSQLGRCQTLTRSGGDKSGH